jgi:hypothetical protein
MWHECYHQFRSIENTEYFRKKQVPIKQSEALVAMYCIEMTQQYVVLKNSEVLTAVSMKTMKRVDNVKVQTLN